MTKQTVCFFIANFDGGGAQKQCIYLINELKKRSDLRVVLVYLHRGKHWSLLDQSGLELHHIKAFSNYDPLIILRVTRVVRRCKADIVLSWMQTCDSYSFFVRALTGWRVRWIMTERNSRYPRGLKFRLRATVGRRANAIVCNSRAGEAYWAGRGSKGRRYVIDNIIVPVELQQATRLPALVLHIGRLENQKNPIAVARAFCALASRRPQLKFAFIGEGSLRRDVENYIAALGLADRVAVVGFRSDVSTFLASASAVVSLSSHEGMPNVLLEAASAGVAVVASSIPEHRDLLGSAYPYYVNSGDDANAVADVILAALDDNQPPSALCDVRARISQMRPEAVAEQYMAIFIEVLTEGGETRHRFPNAAARRLSERFTRLPS